MDNNASLIEQIIDKTNKQTQALTDKIQKLIDTGDFSNAAISTQAQLFSNQLMLITNAGSALVKAFTDASRSIITRIGG